jgi:hypothetical protein
MISALFESPINKIPSGPKARAFTDWISGSPVVKLDFKLFVGSLAITTPDRNRSAIAKFSSFIVISL